MEHLELTYLTILKRISYLMVVVSLGTGAFLLGNTLDDLLFPPFEIAKHCLIEHESETQNDEVKKILKICLLKNQPKNILHYQILETSISNSSYRNLFFKVVTPPPEMNKVS
jgi:hypothetical protein